MYVFDNRGVRQAAWMMFRWWSGKKWLPWWLSQKVFEIRVMRRMSWPSEWATSTRRERVRMLMLYIHTFFKFIDSTEKYQQLFGRQTMTFNWELNRSACLYGPVLQGILVLAMLILWYLNLKVLSESVIWAECCIKGCLVEVWVFTGFTIRFQFMGYWFNYFLMHYDAACPPFFLNTR